MHTFIIYLAQKNSNLSVKLNIFRVFDVVAIVGSDIIPIFALNASHSHTQIELPWQTLMSALGRASTS